MTKFFYLPILFALAFAAACGTSATPAQTPVIIVVTATPQGAAAETPAVALPSPSATRAAGGTATTVPGTVDPNLKPTTVQYILAKQDVNIRSGPGTSFDIVSGVYTANTARVTGFMSADGLWWRVECPTTGDDNCWISADPALTEPADAPQFGPTPLVSPSPGPTPSTEVNVEAFIRQLADAIQKKDYTAMSALMSDPFTIGYWRSEGTEPTRAQALKMLEDSWVGPASDLIFDLADKTDQTALLGGTNPLSMWNPNTKVVKTVYVKGLGGSGTDEALLVIAQRPDGSLYWYGMLFAGGGFA